MADARGPQKGRAAARPFGGKGAKMKRMKTGLIVWLAVLGLTLGATDFYMAPEARGTGTGKSEENAALWSERTFWRQVQTAVNKADTTVHFLPGTYVAYKHDGEEAYLFLSSKGSAEHTLTLRGAEGEGTIFMRDPADPTTQTDDNRLAEIVMLNNCTNLVVENFHFRGSGAIGKGITIQTPHRITIRNCSWVDMRGLYYGAISAGSKGSGVTYENCLFDNVGYHNYAHCIYNLYNTTDIIVRNCIFRDCSGEFLRFRNRNDRSTVENCYFEQICGLSKSNGTESCQQAENDCLESRNAA